MSRLRIVTLAGNPEREADLASRLGTRPDVDLVMRCVDRVELLASIRGANLDGIVCVGAPLWLDPQALEEASRARLKLIGVANDPLEVDHLEALGIELSPLDSTTDDLIERLSSLTVSPPPPPPAVAPKSGKLIAVWGPKGSPGRTTIAIELAALLADRESNTLLVDGDPYGGDVLQMLGIVEEIPSLVWAARMAAKDELDAARLAIELRRAGRGGPVVIPGIPRAELWAEISDYGWRSLLELVRPAFPFSVCDIGFCVEPDPSPYPGAGEGRNRIARTAVTLSDEVVAVCRCDPIGLKNFLWAVDELFSLVDRDRVVVIANRVRQGEERDVAEVLKTHCGKRPIAYVPDRHHLFSRAVMDGVPVTNTKAGADVSSALDGVLARLGGKAAPSGLMARLAGGGA